MTFEEIGAGRTHRLVVSAEATGALVPHSCGDEKFSPVYRYQLLDYAVTTGSE